MSRGFRYSTFRRQITLVLFALLITLTSFAQLQQYTIFQPAEVPVVESQNDGMGAIEIGTKFRVTQDGQVTAFRFYKGLSNTGTHTGHLWSYNTTTGAGTLLSTVIFTGETASGWQQIALPTPIALTTTNTYVVSYFSSAGNYAVTNNYFTSAKVNGPLRGLADGEAGNNGLYLYTTTSAFPISSFQASSYFIDVVFVAPDITAPTVFSVSPPNGTTSVNTATTVSAVFNEALTASTVNSTNFQLRNALGTLVPATVSYNAVNFTATLTPTAALSTATVYTATFKSGGTGIKDVAGNALASDYSWSFTTSPPAPQNGQGGPILVISSTTNLFSRYPVEILRAEGFNSFNAVDISTITAASSLNNYNVVVLGEVPVTAAQVTLFTNWANAGGTLVIFKPGSLLLPLCGLSAPTGTLSDKYLLVNTSNPGPGVGIVNQTIQFHGTANLHTLISGAKSLATLYSTASTATTNPAVTTRKVGSNDGRVIAFTYDLARSIIYTRQGNPAWAATKRDGQPGPIRSDDMFFGQPAGTGVDWIDFSKIAIPQADEQQRLLANIILQGSLHRMPMPRFWYLPRGLKAAIVMTGDDHAVGGTPGRFDLYNHLSDSIGHNTPQDVIDWKAIRGTSYIYPNTYFGASSPSLYQSQGFEIALHANTNCTDYTQTTLTDNFTTLLGDFAASLPSISAPVTNRTHCLPWSDWATHAKVEASKGIRLDANYYYWPGAWVQNRVGMFTGSGMPMRFADLDGTMIDCYQAVTQMTDESGIDISSFCNSLLDKALGPEGYYGVFTTNMHTDTANHTGSNAIIASALARQVPVISAKQMLNWLDSRNNSYFGTMSWGDNQLSFPVTAFSGANNLQAMLPIYSDHGQLTGITKNGSGVSFTTQTIKGMKYAFFDVGAGTNSYVATYTPDTIAPVITNINPVPNFNGTAVITWNTSEGTDSKINYSTDSTSLISNEGDESINMSHSLTLTGLTPGATYYFRLSGTDIAHNSVVYPAPPASPLKFTVPLLPCVYDQTTNDFSLGTTGTNTTVTSDGDGTVILKPVVSEEFSGASVPAGWGSDVYVVGGTTLINNGSVKVNGAHVYSNVAYSPGTSVEFLATFSTASFQNIGFTGDQGFTGSPWVTIGEGNPDGNIYARASNGASVSLGSSLLGTTHKYRIKWNASSFEFFVDDNMTPVATINLAIATTMYVQVSDFLNNDGILAADWIRVAPYSASGTFTSQIFDGGSPKPWGTIMWNKDAPVGTAVNISVRTGNTAIPDGTWTAFVAIPSSGTTVGVTSRYIQYKADFSTTDTKLTATLKDILISCSAPVVTKQPLTQAICDGSNVTFTSVATGTPIPAVKWQMSTDGTIWNNISGAVDTTLTFAVAPADNNKQYRAVWTNTDGVINSSAATLTVKAKPAVPTITVANNCGNSLLTAGSFTGSLLWSNAATTTAITVTDAAAYTVTQSINGCASSPVSATSAPKAVPAAPSVTVIDNCGNSQLTASGFTGSLLWSNAATTSSIMVTNAATYTVTQTLNGCTSTTGGGMALPKTIPSAPAVSIINNCGSSEITASNFTGSLLWSNNATTPVITVTDAASYSVAQTVNGCVSPNGSVTSAPKVVPSAPAVSVVNNCGNSEITASNFTGSLLWSNSATTSSIIVTNAAIYSVTQSVAGCVSTAGSVLTAPKVIPSAPSVAVINNCGSSQLTASGFTGSLLWSNNATASSITVTDAAIYNVAQTVNGCASANGSVTSAPKTVPSAPTVSVTNNCGNSVLTASGIIGSLLWSNNATTSSITVTNTATYSITQTLNGCISAAGSGPSAPKPIPGAPSVSVSNECGHSVLTAGAFTGSLLWSNSFTTPSISVSTPGTYSVTQSVNGCTGAAGSALAVPKRVTPAPVITAKGPTTFCQGGSVTLMSNAKMWNTWSNGATTQSIVVTTPGTYTVMFTGENGCPSGNSDPVVVTVNPIPAAPSISVVNNCGSSVLTAGSFTGSLLWNTGLTTPSVTVVAPGTYSLTQKVNGCTSPAVTAIAAPKAVPSAPTVSVVNNCGNSQLTASNYTGSLLWSNGATTPSIMVTNAATYSVTQTVNGCTSNAGSGVSAPNSGPSAPTITASGATTFCQGGSVTLTSSAATGNAWSTGATTQSIIVNASGSYTVNYIDVNGCTSATSLPTGVTVNVPTSSTTTHTACDSYLWNGQTYTESGTYTATGLTNVAGCDSTPTLLLTIKHSTSSSTTHTACESYIWNGQTYTESGTYTAIGFTNVAGCDSTATLVLTINHATSSTTTHTACNSYLWNAVTYTESGTYTAIGFTNAAGCDSTATLILTINHSSSSTTSHTACDSYLWNGVTYTESGTYTAIGFTNAAGCDSIATLILTINHSSSSTTSHTACDSYLWNGVTYTESGTYTVTGFTNVAGCDSTATLILTINHSSTSSTTHTACDSYLWNGVTYTESGTYTATGFTNVAGCDSTATLVLTINHSSTSSTTHTACDSYLWNGVTYTESGTYTATGFTNVAGCDSTATLILTINHSSSSTTNHIACDSYTWNGQAYTESGTYTATGFTNVAGCDSTATLILTINHSTSSSITVAVCGSYTWNGQAYTESGTYTATGFTNVAGCDSTATLILTITNQAPAAPAITANGVTTFCQGGSVTLTSSEATGNIWSTGATTQSIVVTTSGSYTVSYVDAIGCNSLTSLATVVTVNVPTSSTTPHAACNSYLWNGVTYTESGTYTVTGLTNAAGCDSTATLILTINHSSVSSTTHTACDSYLWNGVTYTESGTYAATGLTNAAGCDSTATLILTINHSSASSTTHTACDSYLWNGQTYTQSGTYTATGFTNAAGCDSTATLILTINHSSTSSTTHTACDSYLWNGTTYTESGTYTATGFTNIAGCDSTATLVLTINHSSNSTTPHTACDSFLWNGVTYTESGTYTVTGLTNAAGCDSTATLVLTINHSSSSTTSHTACDSYLWNGVTYTESGTYVATGFTNIAGCDSTATLVLTINHSTTSTTVHAACESYLWNGVTYTESGTYTATGFTNVAGCDSTATLELTINHATSSTTTHTACDSYLWNGVTYTESGTYTVTGFTNAAGCDSTATLILTINHSSGSTTSHTACDSYLWNGVTYTESGTYSVPGFTNAAGCDSTATLILTINHSSGSTTNHTACDSYLWNGVTYTESGTYTVPGFTNVAGCDSTATLILTINHSTTSTTTHAACESYLWNGVTYTESGTYTATGFTNIAGCDSTATLILTINHATSSTTSHTACDSYLWNGVTYTESGTYTATGFTNAAGCDSTATLILTINHSTSSTTTHTACDSYLWNGVTYTESGTYTATGFTNIAGCDSTATLILTINHSTSSTTTHTACDSYLWNGVTYTESGTYIATGFTNIAGCDSTATLELTINHATSSTTTHIACDSYLWNGVTYTESGTYTVNGFTNVAGCDSTATLILTITHSTSSSTPVTACNSYLWNGVTYTESGTYVVNGLTNAAGCDSTATLVLIINHSAAAPTITADGATTFCQGGSVTLTSSAATGNVWSTGATTQSIIVSAAGSYTVSFVDDNGCTSLVSLPTIITVNVPTSSTTIDAGCESYLWNGVTYTESGTYTATGFTNIAGCDSTATLILTINHSSSSTTTHTACDSYLWNGVTYTESGTHTANGFINAVGCDSTATLILTINHSTTSSASVTECNSYLWNGVTYTESGTYIATGFINAAGCDSTATLVLTINHSAAAPTITADGAITFCQGGSVTLTSSAATGNVWSTGETTQSIVVNTSGSYTVSFVDANGCTSLVSLPTLVTVNVPTSSTTPHTACDSYLWNGVTYTESGTYTVNGLTNAAGCDSTATLLLTINHSTSSSTTHTACDSYLWNGQTYTESGTYIATGLVNAAGCDSTATLVLTINHSTSSTTSYTACDSYVWNGQTYTESGTYTATGFTNIAGCDSTAILVLTINHSTTSTTTHAACESYLWNGVTYTQSGTYTVEGLTNVAGCDSTAALVLTINHSTSSSTPLTTCNSYLWNGVTYTVSGTYTATGFTNVAGCDSTATLILTINQSPAAPTITADGATTICQGATVTLTSSATTGNVWSTGATTQSIVVNASGSYTVSYVDANGCTSATSLPTVVTVNMPTSSTTNITICVSEIPYHWNDLDFFESTTYVAHLVNAAGCDSAATLVLEVSQASVGGTVSSNATVCSGSNSGLLTLSGNTGDVIRWEQSTDGGTNWTPIANTTTTLNYTNITGTTMFRAVVQSGNCALANSSDATITVVPGSVGGSVSGSATVCPGSNSGTVTLSGHTGNVIRWEQSINGGGAWTPIANTTTSQSYTDLAQTTMFRAVVQNSPCTTANSSAATITVNAATVGGTVSGTATLCSLTNSGTLTLSGNTGNVIRWERSTDGGANWTPIVNTTTTQSYTNVLVTTQYRAVVQNGSCNPANSAVATLTLNRVSVNITVSPDSLVCTGTTIVFSAVVTNGGTTPTYSWKRNTTTAGTSSSLSQSSLLYSNNDVFTVVVTSNASCVVGSPVTSNAIRITKYSTSNGGGLSGTTTHCSATNSGTVTLSGHTGTVVRWEQSPTGAAPWTNIANTTTSLSYTNLAQTMVYRALVQSGPCSSDYSSTETINVLPVTGGTTTGSTSVCSGSNTGSITLSGHSGTISRWESSTNGGGNWSNIGNTTTTLTYTNLTTTTQYRARMTNGSCIEYSTVSTITVGSVGGTVSGTTTQCSTTNTGTLTLSGQVGSVIRWESSPTGAAPWTTINNTTTSNTYNNLISTTVFRAVVQLGSCAIANSSNATVTVTPVTGGTTTGSTTVCSGSNSGSITVSGHSGTISRWESSTNGFANISNINTSATSINYSNLTQTTQYRARLINGTCIDFSSVTTITVSPVSVGGTVSGTATVCSNGNSGTVTLNGNTGAVVRWEQSINAGGAWTQIASTAGLQSYQYTNLTQNTLFRAIVQNSPCVATATSGTVTITVTTIAGGTTTGSNSFCSGAANSGSITLSGHTGAISRWESSIDGGSNWSNITNVTTTLNYSNLSTTTQYRARITAGSCIAFSTVSTITIKPLPTLTSSLTASVLTGDLFTYTPTSSVGSTTFNWTRATVAGISNAPGSGSGNISETLDNTTASPVNATYVYTLSANGCPGLPQNVVVTVNPPSGGRLITTGKQVPIAVPEAKETQSEVKLDISAMPNPSSSYFTLVIKSNSESLVMVRVLNLYGTAIETHNKISSNTTLRLGKEWVSGVYFAEVIQDGKRKVIRLVKVN